MSPTAPTFVTLNDLLNKAHRRIRELQAHETELLAQIGTLCAVVTELPEGDACHAFEVVEICNPTTTQGNTC